MYIEHLGITMRSAANQGVNPAARLAPRYRRKYFPRYWFDLSVGIQRCVLLLSYAPRKSYSIGKYKIEIKYSLGIWHQALPPILYPSILIEARLMTMERVCSLTPPSVLPLVVLAFGPVIVIVW